MTKGTDAFLVADKLGLAGVQQPVKCILVKEMNMVDHVSIITLSLVLHLLSLESLLLYISLWNVVLFVRMVYLSDDHYIWQVGEVPISLPMRNCHWHNQFCFVRWIL